MLAASEASADDLVYRVGKGGPQEARWHTGLTGAGVTVPNPDWLIDSIADSDRLFVRVFDSRDVGRDAMFTLADVKGIRERMVKHCYIPGYWPAQK